MKQVLSAMGVAFVLCLAEKYDIEPWKLIEIFNELAPEEEDDE